MKSMGLQNRLLKVSSETYKSMLAGRCDVTLHSDLEGLPMTVDVHIQKVENKAPRVTFVFDMASGKVEKRLSEFMSNVFMNKNGIAFATLPGVELDDMPAFKLFVPEDYPHLNNEFFCEETYFVRRVCDDDFQGDIDTEAGIQYAIKSLAASLSPENLYADGERSPEEAAAREAHYEACVQELGKLLNIDAESRVENLL